MKRQKFIRPVARLLLGAMLLNFALLLAACGGPSGASAAAATMHLKKTEGTVGVADSEGNDVAPAENLGLYSGYTVATEEESYAWIDLDAVKLAKMDAESAVEVVQDGKNLTVNVQTGSLFFNVTEPLADDETMEISTSSMLVGIRGTCGWVTRNSAALLEGTVTVTAGEQAVTVTAGEMAVLTEDGALEVKPFSAAAVPAFVRTEVAEDEKLAAEVLEAAGMDLTADTPVALYADSIARYLDDVLYTEWVDFANDGKPELLVIGIWIHAWDTSSYSDRNVKFLVFSDDPAKGPINNGNGRPLLSEEVQGPQEYTWSLVEADGKQFVEFYWNIPQRDSGPYHGERAEYYGLDGEGNLFYEMVGYTVRTTGSFSGSHAMQDGQQESKSWDCDLDEFAATRAKYSPVKQLLYSPDGKEVTVTAP